MFNSPLLNVFGQILALGPKVAPSWGLYILHRLLIIGENIMFVAPSVSIYQVCSHYATGSQKMAKPRISHLLLRLIQIKVEVLHPVNFVNIIS